MGKPVSHKARIAALALLCAAGFGIPAVLFLSVGQAPSSGEKKPVAPVTESETASEPIAKLEAGQKPDGAELTREPAREPLSPLASPQPPAAPPDPETSPKRWRIVHQPVATAAGVLDVGGVSLALPGLDALATEESCTDANGVSWPCGMGARTAFRAYLRGRSLNCKLPDQRPVETIFGECLLQGDDPAAWLVRNGWARAKADGPYTSLESEARQARRGIFGAKPR